MRALLLAALLLAGCATSSTLDDVRDPPAIEAAPVAYDHGGERLVGWLVRDANRAGPRPGVLVVHEWWGLGDHPRRKADELARLGYVALCVDMYGEGRLTKDPKQAGEWAGKFRTPEGKLLGRERMKAALDVLRATPGVDPERIGAIGFCFGGTVCLELAWSGAPVKGVVSFHGNPTAPLPEDVKGVKASVLLCHGANDDLVPAEAMAAFEKAVRDGNLDGTVVKYPGAVHSFTNPDADGSFNPLVRYDARADRRSWEDMRAFFRELFSE
jgi:dienelactone hydrolase